MSLPATFNFPPCQKYISINLVLTDSKWKGSRILAEGGGVNPVQGGVNDVLYSVTLHINVI